MYTIGDMVLFCGEEYRIFDMKQGKHGKLYDLTRSDEINGLSRVTEVFEVPFLMIRYSGKSEEKPEQTEPMFQIGKNSVKMAADMDATKAAAAYIGVDGRASDLKYRISGIVGYSEAENLDRLAWQIAEAAGYEKCDILQSICEQLMLGVPSSVIAADLQKRYLPRENDGSEQEKGICSDETDL